MEQSSIVAPALHTRASSLNGPPRNFRRGRNRFTALAALGIVCTCVIVGAVAVHNIWGQGSSSRLSKPHDVASLTTKAIVMDGEALDKLIAPVDASLPLDKQEESPATSSSPLLQDPSLATPSSPSSTSAALTSPSTEILTTKGLSSIKISSSSFSRPSLRKGGDKSNNAESSAAASKSSLSALTAAEADADKEGEGDNETSKAIPK